MRQRKQTLLAQWLDSLSINMLHRWSRGRIWLTDQKINAKLRKTQPDLPVKYPFRAPLPEDLHQLYLETVRDTQQALGVWHNPWLLVPPCFFGYELEELAFYRPSRHEISLSQAFEYWHGLLCLFLPLRAAIKQAKEGTFHQTLWEQVHHATMKHVTDYREKLEKLQNDLLPRLSLAWSLFEQQLPALLEECRHQGCLTEKMVAWNTSLEELDQMLRKCLRSLLMHELIHAWTRRVNYKHGKQMYQVIGLMEERSGSEYLHRAMNEGLTEWITQRLYQQMYGEAPAFVWRECTIHNGYPFWIIDYLVQALDHEWRRITPSLPILDKHHIVQASDLLYTLCFVDAQAVAWLKQALSLLSGDPDAFSKVSQACDHFSLPIRCDAASLAKSWNDLYQLFSPFLQEGLCLPPFLKEMLDDEL